LAALHVTSESLAICSWVSPPL